MMKEDTSEDTPEMEESAASEQEIQEPAAAQTKADPEPETPETRAKKAWDMLLRTTADFDNYKKRAARERAEAVKYANESLLEKLIPVLDTFDMALTATQNAQADSVEALKTGIVMIHQQLRSVLMEAGLSEVEAMEQPFDPNVHEAISQQETADVPEGRVVQQTRKGYRLRDRLLRPASVVVSKRSSK